MRRLFVFLSGCLALTTAAQAYDQSQVNLAIDSAERICLVGSRYKFEADAQGDLTIKKLTPGVEAKVTVDNIRSKGSQFFQNENVRQVVDKDIRECMQSQWPVVLKALDEPAQPAQKTPRITHIICHGEYDTICLQHPYTIFEHCGNDNGVGGADPNASGVRLCGNNNFKTRATAGGKAGNHCGYAWFAVDCY